MGENVAGDILRIATTGSNFVVCRLHQVSPFLLRVQIYYLFSILLHILSSICIKNT